MRCAGILLTGGASSRLGHDKALVRLRPGGPTLAERAAAALADVAFPVVEVGPGRTDLPVGAEPPGRQGPLVALAAGLAALGAGTGPATDGVLLLACDMPLVTTGLLRWLAQHPSRGSVVPLAGDPPRAQPLCARWSVGALSIVSPLVAGGERSLRPLLAHHDVLLAPPAAWSEHAGPAGDDALLDVDTPVHLARVRALLNRVGP